LAHEPDFYSKLQGELGNDSERRPLVLIYDGLRTTSVIEETR